MENKTIRIWLLVIFAVLFFISCQNSNSGSNPKITGEVGSSFSIGTNRISSKAGESGDTSSDGLPVVEYIKAFPISHPFVNNQTVLSNTVEADLNSDGSFSISLDSDTDYIVALMNSNADKKNQFAGYVALSDAVDNMVLIPTSHITDDVDTGELTADGDEAESENSLEDNISNFDIDLSKLQEFAKTDDLLKTVKNIYVNYDDQTGVLFRNSAVCYR